MHLFLIRIGILLVSQSKKIVYTDMIKPGKSNQYLRRNHAFPTFVVSIGSLGNIDLLAEISLREVRIFP